MTHIDLYDATNTTLVERVLVPAWLPGPAPELVAWGSRFFIPARLGNDWEYREVKCLQVYTQRQHDAMARG